MYYDRVHFVLTGFWNKNNRHCPFLYKFSIIAAYFSLFSTILMKTCLFAWNKFEYIYKILKLSKTGLKTYVDILGVLKSLMSITIRPALIFYQPL